MAEWWRQLESDLAAADQAIQREHQAAIAAGKPWPPERRPQSEPEHVPKPESNLRTAQEADVQSGPDDQAARLDELFAQATGAAERLPRKRLTGTPEPSTPLVSSEKPMQSPRPPRRPKPHTRQTSSCQSGCAGAPAIVAIVTLYSRCACCEMSWPVSSLTRRATLSERAGMRDSHPARAMRGRPARGIVAARRGTRASEAISGVVMRPGDTR